VQVDARPVMKKHTTTAPRCQIQVQGALLAASVSFPTRKIKVHSKRGKVYDFSKKARHRCLKRLAILDFSTYKGSFVTLTYKENFRDRKRAFGHLRAFIKAIYALPETQGKMGACFWRYELQKRGAIHFHLLWQRAPYIHWKVMRKAWAIASNQTQDNLHTHIKKIDSPSKARHYISKYIAKVSGFGKLANVPYLARGEFPQSHCSDEHIGRHSGRHWGVEKRSLAVYCPATWFKWKGSIASIVRLKLIVARLWDGIDLTTLHGFSFFIDSPQAWYAVVKQCLDGEPQYQQTGVSYG